MLKLDDFKKMEKFEILNDRFIVGGYARPTTYHGGYDYYYDKDHVTFSGHKPKRDGNPTDDPK